MRPNDHTEIVPLQERVQVVNTEVDNIILFLRISDVIVLEPSYVFALMRITPKKIDNFLVVVHLIRAQFYFKRSLDLFDTLDISNSWTNATVATKDPLLLVSDYSCKWQIVKSIIDFGKTTVWIINVFIESLGALISESQVFIHVSVFVVASQKHDLSWIFQFQCH